MASEAPVTHYELLGVPVTATTQEIKDAYLRCIRTAHPDRGGNTGMFRLVRMAYETLADPARRAEYDRSQLGFQREKPEPQSSSKSETNHRPKPDPKPNQRPDPTSKADSGNHRSNNPKSGDSSPRYSSPKYKEAAPHLPLWPGPQVQFWPPARGPENTESRGTQGVPRWRVLWMLGFIAAAVPIVVLPLMVIEAAGPVNQNRELATAMGSIAMSGLVLCVVTALVPIVRYNRRPELPQKSLEDYLPGRLPFIASHGLPGRSIPLSRQGGESTSMTAQQETARVIVESVLPSVPSARLVNGIRSFNALHPFVHHVVLAGERMAVLDSFIRPDGEYVWNQTVLIREGEGTLSPTIGVAVASLRNQFPKLTVEGWLVIHSQSGVLRKPAVRTVSGVPPAGAAGTGIVNAEGLCWALHGFLAGGTNAAVVDAAVLAELLRRMYGRQ